MPLLNLIPWGNKMSRKVNTFGHEVELQEEPSVTVRAVVRDENKQYVNSKGGFMTEKSAINWGRKVAQNN